jgi:hypothetical protein
VDQAGLVVREGDVQSDIVFHCRSPSLQGHMRVPELIYPFHDPELLVTACGRLCLHRKRINISTVLAGQKLGINNQ